MLNRDFFINTCHRYIAEDSLLGCVCGCVGGTTNLQNHILINRSNFVKC